MDHFELIWWCRSPFWVWFDCGFDPFIPITGIMSKLEYRLGIHICLHFAWTYDCFILTLGMNPFYLVTEPSCCFYEWHYVNGRAFPYMGTLVRSCFAFGAHAGISPLECGSFLYITAMTLSKSFIFLMTFYVGHFPRNPLYMTSFNCISWVFLSLLSLMPASLTMIIRYIAQACLMSRHTEPFYISFTAWFPIFYQEGTFPWVSLSYTCVLALSIGMFYCLELVCFPIDTRLLLVYNYKTLLFFFKLFKIFEKV